jgi:alpha-ribazole phosphatase
MDRIVTRFWLIRHGEPAADARQRCYGSLDVGLSETGRAQMADVADYLSREPVAAIYSSPLSRAIESAQILATARSASVEVVNDFREIDFGDFEGLTYDEIASRYPDIYRQWMETPTGVRFPNGESYTEVQARVLRAFDTIQRERQEQTTVIVSHGGVNRIILAWALQIPDACLFRIAQGHAAINLLAIVDRQPSVRLLNYIHGAGTNSHPNAMNE